MKLTQPPPVTFGRMIENNERHRGNHPAIVMDDVTVTHGELAVAARKLSSALHRIGCRRQDRVAMMTFNSIEQCIIYAAGELSGFIVAPVNFRQVGEEVAYQLNDCTPQVFFFQKRFADLVAAIRHRLTSVRQFVCIEEALDWATDFQTFLAHGDEAGAPFRAREADVAYLIYTSGTTGKPKGCMLGHGTQMHTIIGSAADLGMGRVDRALVVMPLFHVGGKVVQLNAQLHGATTVIADRFDPDDYLRTLHEQRITVGHLAPLMIQQLLESPLVETLDFSALRVVLYSAAAMPTAVLRRAIELFGKIFQQQYGLTETCGTSLHRLEHDPDGDEVAQRRLGSVGVPFPGTDLRIADEDGNALPSGKAGEILFRTPSNMMGYWNNSAATIDVLRDGWLRTGDIGMIDEDGYCYLVDRKKDMIISGGENIYSREVEEVLFAHPAILEAAVIGIPDPKWGEAVCAIIVLRSGESLTEQEVVDYCRTRLAGYKKPRRTIFVDNIARLASGKINKVELRKQYTTEG